MLFEYRHQYCYLADVNQEDIEKKNNDIINEYKVKNKFVSQQMKD